MLISVYRHYATIKTSASPDARNDASNVVYESIDYIDLIYCVDGVSYKPVNNS